MSTNQDARSSDDLYCPHLQNINEESLRQLFSKVAAVRSEDPELFKFTHRPIRVFRTPEGTETQDQTVHETEVYRKFSDSRPGNFSVVIEGEVGTGKSELCAYLAHQLADNDDRPILHVDKNDDLMTLLSERIPEFYQEHFNEELSVASNFKQLRQDLEQNGRVVANNATSGAILNLARNYRVDAAGKEDKIREFVQDELSLLVEKGEYAKEVKFVTEPAYRRNDFLQVIEEDVGITEAVTNFNEELWREIRDRYETASLDDVLEQVGKQFTETRPVIIFEDFAITAMEGRQLRNYMERDNPSDNWDFIVAGTRDSTKILHKMTANDRFKFYRTNRQNSNSVLFLDEDSAVDFIRPYLGYLKSFDGSVNYDRSGDGLELSLHPAPNETECAQCGFCDESFRDLFPFNEPFLHRIYTGLNDDEQSPREYVMAVFDILRDYYERYVQAPSDADRLSSLRNPIDPATVIFEQEESVAMLARWYGIATEDGITVDRRFVEAFGLASQLEALDSVERRESTIVIPSASGGVVTGGSPGKGGSGGDGSDGDGSDGDGSGGSAEPSISKAQRIINEYRPNVQPWQQNPADFPEINRYLRRGLRDALDRLTGGFGVFESTDLGYNLSSQTEPFVFKSAQKAPDDDQIIIDPEALRISDLQKLLEFGIYREEDVSQADYEELFRQLGTQLTGYARRWQEKIRQENLRSSQHLFKQNANYQFEDFALAGYAYAVMLDSPFEELSAEALNRRFIEGSPYTVDADLRSELKTELTKDEYNSVVTFMEYSDQFEELVGAFFGASANVLDVATVRDQLSRNPPYKVIEGLGRQYIKRVSPRVRFDTDNKIRDIADSAYDLQGALQAIDDEYRSDVTTAFIEDLSEISLSDLDEMVRTLKTYDGVDTEMVESMSKFVSLNQTDIDDAVSAAELASELISGVTDEQLQAIFISMKLSATDVHQRYNDITVVGAGQSSEFAEHFQSVGEHYVE